MPKLLFFLLALLMFQLLSAQKLLSEFTAHYQLTFKKNDAEQLKSDWHVAVKGPLSRVDLISKTGTETTVLDGKTGSGRIFKEYSGQKLLINLKSEDWKSMNENFNNTAFEVVASGVNYNGYKCNKAIGKTSKLQNVEVWFLPDLMPVNKDYNMAFKQIKGLPIKTIVTALKDDNSMEIIYEMTNLNTDLVPINTFEPPITGFRVLSYEEMNKNKN